MNSLFLLTTNKLQRHYWFTTDLLQTGGGGLQKHYWFTTNLLLNYVITVLWTIRTSDPLLFMLDVLANASRSRNKLRPRSPFSGKKNAGNRTSPGWMVWNSALCTCAHTHACVKTEPARFWRVFGWFVACFTGFPSETPWGPLRRCTQRMLCSILFSSYYLDREW